MFIPKNEQGTIIVFSAQAQERGWEFVSVGTAFPDAVMRYDGDEWQVEFEYKASNFIDHEHDVRKCDLIICWENDWVGCPLPVLAINKSEWQAPIKADPDKVDAAYWKQRALNSEKTILQYRDNGQISEPYAGSIQDRHDKPLIDLLVNMVKMGKLAPQDITVQYIRHGFGPNHYGKQIYLERAKRIRDVVSKEFDWLD